MNEEPSIPSDHIGDAALEARIVAWVLGEASSFEAAELERLCDEKPELMEFARSIRSLHGLLLETESNQTADAWKLSAEKRKMLEDISGHEVVGSGSVGNDARIRHSGRRALFAVAACLVLILTIIKMMSPFYVRKSVVVAPEKTVDFMPRSTSFAPGPQAEPEQLGSSFPLAGQPRSRASGMQEEVKRRQIAKSPQKQSPLPQISSIPEGKFELADQNNVDSIPMTRSALSKSESAIGHVDSFAPAPVDGPVADNSAPDSVRRALYTAEGLFNLGRYEDAKKDYEEVLKIDPSNTAARRGLERVDSAKSDYYRAGYDHTRASLLSQVDGAWELTVPSESEDETKPPGLAAKGKQQTLSAAQPILTDAPADAVAPAQEQSLSSLFNKRRMDDDVTAGGPDLQDAKDVDLYAISGVEMKAKQILKPDADLKKEFPERAAKLGDVVSPTPPASPAEQAPGAERDKAPITPEDEVSSTENVYSTFSLNVSDASFQIAKAALEKGERPDPDQIRVEQFYNAVDYGDPAPARDEPVAATIEQAAHPVIPGRNLVRVALRTGAAGRSASQPLRLTLLVDQSGSMVREDRRQAMERALVELGTLLKPEDRITVIGFSRTPRLLAEAMSGDQAAKLSGLVNQPASEGGTNLEEAMKLGSEMAIRHQLAGGQNRIVLFTDGAANLGNADPRRLAAQVKELRQKGISFDIAGIGADGVNDLLLGELARNGNGRYHVVSGDAGGDFAGQLAGAFRPAAENVKVQVRFNPQRVGKYKLIGFEKERLNTEDFRNDAVDAAEMAAEEAGVALYQVEILPGGSGEVGEVSVRFRDTSEDRMVERSWTIRYDSAAPAFDRSLPSMKLAGIAMLAGEKLKGGALAEATDFSRISASIAEVKQFYGSSPRVAEMLHVVDAVR